MGVVRTFCLCRRRREPASFLPDARLFPPRHQVIRPHLFTTAEGVRLLAAISAVPAAPTSPFRRENLRLRVGILYTTGFWVRAFVLPILADYDPRDHTFRVGHLKLHQSSPIQQAVGA